MFLDDDELYELTGYRRNADQRKWLKARGWRFEISASGRPVVSRNYADTQLGAASSATKADKDRREWKPNVAAIKKAA